MKTMKRIISGILAAVMVAASAAFVSAEQVTFTDRFIDDGSLHWAWQRGYIPYLVEKGVLNGYKQDDGTYMFKPEGKVTRAEFVKMLDETFGLTETADIRNQYSDVPESEWFYGYFAKAVKQGYLLNYGEKANPNDELSREEATVLLVRYLDLPQDEKVATTTFADYDKIHPNFRDYILRAAKAEVINGYEEDNGTYTFRPQNTLTRAEALTILYRAAGGIFTGDTSGAEAAAYEKNAVVKNGGITLSNQVLDGRVIVSEGADNGTVAFYRSRINDTLYIRGGANIVFDAATINTVVVDSKDIINITVQAETVIEHLIINERTNVTLGTGTTVKKLTVADGAQFTTVSGSGKIKEAVISASDFSASMIPETYEIAKGITASFASKSYKGSSATQQVFASTPFVSVESNYHCINMTAVTAGSIRYYFTDTAAVPDADDFDFFYTAANYRNTCEVRANKSEAKITYSYSQVKDYDYVVLQMTANGTVYEPIVISNEVAEGTGFSKDPYLKSQNKIEFTTKAAGTVYYMYTDLKGSMTASDFLAAYNDQSKELKGEITDRTAEITINPNYTDMNSSMVFMYKSASGLCYTPVSVSFGDTGFFIDPEMDADGIISAIPAVDGTIYLYYAETATLPTSDKFISLWRSAPYSSYELVTTGREVIINVEKNLPSKYKYMILCIRDDDKNYLTPVALKLEGENGFEIAPEISDNGKILFKPSAEGIVYYYYSKDASAPTIQDFDENYADASGYRGLVEVDGGFETITFDPKKAASYPYMVFMLEDDEKTSYRPVVLSLSGVSGTGFRTEPYVNASTVYFKTDYDCEVWWYYARFDDPVSADNFSGKYDQAYYGDSLSVTSGTLESFTINTNITDSYPYIVISTSEYVRDVFTTPIILNVKGISENVDSAGIKITDTSKYEVTLTSFVEGTVYYYETNDSLIPTKKGFDMEYVNTESAYRGYVSVYEGEKNVEISISGMKKYLVLQLESEDAQGSRIFYDVVQVNLTTGGSTGGNTSSGTGTDVTKCGFDIKAMDTRNSKMTILPQYNGKLTVSIGTADMEWILTSTKYDAVKGENLVVTYPAGITSLGDKPLYIFLQLEGANGTKYAAHPAIPVIPQT